MTLRLRDLTDDERAEVQRITRSLTLGAAFVRRAQIVVHAMSGLKAEEIARRMDLCGNTVRHWINRFNARGLDGLEEDVRTGRPPTYSSEQRSAVITAVLTRPTELGLPFACWTLNRLVAYLSDWSMANCGKRDLIEGIGDEQAATVEATTCPLTPPQTTMTPTVCHGPIGDGAGSVVHPTVLGLTLTHISLEQLRSSYSSQIWQLAGAGQEDGDAGRCALLGRDTVRVG
jgi:transposase